MKLRKWWWVTTSDAVRLLRSRKNGRQRFLIVNGTDATEDEKGNEDGERRKQISS